VTDPFGTDEPVFRIAGQSLTSNVREALQDSTLTRTIEGAATIELTIHDPDRELVKSALLSQRSTATLDSPVFELVQVRKQGSALTVVFEDAVVADLRRATTLVSAKANTTTIDAFARRLVAKAPGAKLVAYTGQRNLAPLAAGTTGGTVENYWEALQRLAQERAWRAFVDRGTVYLGPDSWLSSRLPAVAVREHTDGVDDIDWDADSGKKAPRGSFEANLTRWGTAPGSPVNVLDQGLGSGLWLVSEITRPLFKLLGTVSLVRQQPVIPEPKPEPRDDGGPSTTKSHGSSGSSLAGPVSSRGFSWPLTGPLTSGFGQRSGKLHAGQDIGVPTGTPVHAIKAGTVIAAGPADGYGIAVYLEHTGGVVSRYGHLSAIQVRRGQVVDRGDVIALSGNTGTSTGPHLHLEIRIAGSPVDPLPYLPSRR
jgi:murein DD-endopeptidase MepM/ murein hydrolase activator NlpD